MREPFAPRTWSAGAWLYMAMVALTVSDQLFALPHARDLATGLLLVFVLIEARHVPRMHQLASLTLLAIALVTAFVRGEVIETIIGGLSRTLPFVLVLGSVGWLQAAAGQSPSVITLRELLSRLGPGKRFAALDTAAHFLGSGFNLAAVALLAPMFSQEPSSTQTGMRLRCAVLWGFGSATCWSPFFVGTAAVLTSVPEVSWLEVLPYGVLIAVYFLSSATLYDRFVRRKATRAAVQGGPALKEFSKPSLNSFAALIVLFLATFSLVDLIGLPLTVSIAIVAPLYSLGWLLVVHGWRGHGKIAGTANAVLSGLSKMRSETTLFVSANIFGYAMAELAASEAQMVEALLSFHPPVFLAVLGSLLAYLAVSALGVHPVVSLVIFTTVINPTELAFPTPLLVATMMALWGVGTSVSPFSGTSLYMSQLSSTSSFRIAWRWNGPYFLWLTLGLAVLVTLLA